MKLNEFEQHRMKLNEIECKDSKMSLKFNPIHSISLYVAQKSIQFHFNSFDFNKFIQCSPDSVDFTRNVTQSHSISLKFESKQVKQVSSRLDGCTLHDLYEFCYDLKTLSPDGVTNPRSPLFM